MSFWQVTDNQYVKPVFDLKAEEPAEAAVLRMAAELITVARHYENGILEDTDSEFVHQYRVSIRKARSLISLFKKCLSAERYQLLKTELNAIGSATNLLRDLDVILYDHDDYRRLLPEDLRPGLEQLFARISLRRKRVQRQVVSRLASIDYAGQMSELLQTLQEPADMETEQAQQPIKALVIKKVLKQYRRICRDGAAITDDSPDEAVHRLRIDCKKLRYLLELFTELFPKKQLKPLVGRLKKLQDNLGRFNDFSVQQRFLRESDRGKNLSPEMLAAIYGLIAVLYNQQLNERTQVEANITAFSTESVSSQFRKLFAAIRGREE